MDNINATAAAIPGNYGLNPQWQWILAVFMGVFASFLSSLGIATCLSSMILSDTGC
jgi:hypothetical protein